MNPSNKKGFTLIELLVVISIIGILAGLGLQAIPMVKEQVNILKRKDNLKQLSMLLMVYANDWNCYPTVQPSSTRFDIGGGVADLYPLYATGILEDSALTLLQPPGAALRPFPKNPGPKDFNKNTIGLSYNSTAMPGETGNIPLLADQGVSSGALLLNTTDKGIKPISKKNAIILFTNGMIESIGAVKGKLSTSKVSSSDWGLLKD